MKKIRNILILLITALILCSCTQRETEPAVYKENEIVTEMKNHIEDKYGIMDMNVVSYDAPLS